MSDKDNLDVKIDDARDASTGVATGRKTAVILDRQSGRAWSGEGATVDEATTKAVRGFVGDRRAREYLPSSS